MSGTNKRILPACCEDGARVDLSKVSFPDLTVDFWDPLLWKCVFYILLCPVFWILVSHLEYKRRWLSRVFCGSAYVGCTVVGGVAIGLALLRNWSFREVISSQPKWIGLQENWILWIGHTLVLLGACLVLTSFLNMGFYGTYFGVYFGLRLPHRIYSFPYSVMDHPMYWGSYMIFTGTALFLANQTALLLACLIGITYWITVMFERPIIEAIHARMTVCQGTQTVLSDVETKVVSEPLPATASPNTSPTHKSKKSGKKSKEVLKRPTVENIGKETIAEKDKKNL